jgi:hypothetical protein
LDNFSIFLQTKKNQRFEINIQFQSQKKSIEFTFHPFLLRFSEFNSITLKKFIFSLYLPKVNIVFEIDERREC